MYETCTEDIEYTLTKLSVAPCDLLTTPFYRLYRGSVFLRCDQVAREQVTPGSIHAIFNHYFTLGTLDVLLLVLIEFDECILTDTKQMTKIYV